MSKNTVSIIAILISIVLFMTFIFPFNINASSYGWYCKRTKDHTQPSLPDEFKFITQYGGFYIDNKNNDPNASIKKVYLTFDAGYENGNVGKILDVLKDNDVKGAFFILSNLIASSPELVKRMTDEGHMVCNHTSKHKDMSRVTDISEFNKELSSLESLYKNTVGKEMAKYFRPPEGRFSESTLRFAKELGYKTIFWSFAYADWDNGSQMSENEAKAKIMDNIHNGAVLLLHPTSATNAAILGDIIVELKAKGYTFGTLDELVQNEITG